MKKIDIVNVDTCEVLGTVTTRYHSIESLMNNVWKWLKRHSSYRYVTAEELDDMGIKWSKEIFYVIENKHSEEK